MLTLFYKIKTGKRGQLATFLVFILVIFLIFAFVSVNLGKLAVNRTKTSNAADAAALAAGSAASQLLNYMAGYNEMMLLNISGLASQLVLMITVWIVDFALAINWVAGTYLSHYGGSGSVPGYAYKALDSIASLGLGAEIMILMIDGATNIGNSLEDRINDLNPKMPETTRNVARQYGFMNAGINEPKEEYDDWLASNGLSDSDAVWQQYLDEESTFGAFMRTLTNTNKSDGDFLDGNKLSFSWSDERRTQEMTGVNSSGKVQTGQKIRRVTNKVAVATWPMKPLSLEEKDFKNLSNDSGLRDEIKSALGDVGLNWAYKTWVQLGITMAPVTYSMLDIMWVLMALLIVIIGVYLVISAIMWYIYTAACIVYTACCAVPYTAAVCCPVLMPYYCTWLLPAIIQSIIWLAAELAAAIAAEVLVLGVDPDGIPAFMYGSANNDMTVNAEIRRSTTALDDLDYGLWSMNYPDIASYSKVSVDGTGGSRLFPPVQDYWPNIMSVK
ncbi:MAG: hypothetical protein COV72_05745 [Candidatus Omnitrophica bacterium CG11_big_fil_rev_8_21_14_0_20_42_13]|uniref:Putative Flp pilus-assembly TadG-like N-terminal domain-containing protein n=1 Tax=Candidatus Ghiorseimicrobium undicola TaxID=1974746 RepID=A0A2H0LX34_9BACT|nr:MAG: hypothetical protein COV72_05745 [Candidatus Omnitrophica bacterium CG11_big_fil_rev_8_21_14_0_20_42_13]